MAVSLLSSYAGWPIIVGSGLAGLSVALHLQQPCLLLSPDPQGKRSSSQLAQGGMAAAIGPGDTPHAHALDTLRAGVGLCDETVVNAITAAAPQAVETLLKWGVPLARHENHLALHLEGAHSVPRVVFAGGDQSGAQIISTLWAHIHNTPRIHIMTGHTLKGFYVENGTLQGVYTSAGFIPTPRCVLATGSCGGLYRHTTIPLSNKGMGLAYAAHIGARLADMEFTQFHPTALETFSSHTRCSLISEAVRGAGALLIRDDGERFVKELAPRDVVSRAITTQLKAGHRVYLDGRTLTHGVFSEHFPGITASCRSAGLNPDTQCLPIKPAMHYHMGGIAVDQNGHSSVPGLWACGEVACTGLHGANRLASNSLLEALVCGKWIARDLDTHPSPKFSLKRPNIPPPTLSANWGLHNAMEKYAGLLRTAQGLTSLLNLTLPLARTHGTALTASLIAWAALQRSESRGSHYREDAPSQHVPQRISYCISDLPSL